MRKKVFNKWLVIVIAISFTFTLASFVGSNSTGFNYFSKNYPPGKKNKKRPESPVVKSITKYKIYPEDSVGYILQKELFNEKGWRITYIGYDYYGSGKETRRINFIHDENGNVIKDITDNGDYTTTEIHFYDKDGRLLKSGWSNEEREVIEEKYFYNEKGDEIEIKYFDDGEYDFSRVFEHEYDKKGRIVSQKKWEKYTDGSNDLLSYHISMSYDKNGNVIEKFYYRSDGTPYRKDVNKYDKAGNLIEEYEYDGDELETLNVNTYNVYGETIKNISYNGSKELNYTNTYRYDKYGYLVYLMYVHDNGDAWGSRRVYEFY